jgi:ribonuclease E
VANLEPAIQAAFVEIGIGRNGFLHVSDLLPVYAGAKQIPIDLLSHRPSPRPRRIQEILQKGQEILVQISKDSIGAKGPSLTTYISIPGKYLVLMPGVSRFGVSKRIQDGVERAKLRESLSSLDPPKGLGYIVRTAGKDKPREVLEKDLKQLVETWEVIGGKIRDCPGPCLIFEESGLLMRALRDFCGPDCDEILINEEGAYQRVRTFLKEIMPPTDKSVRLYTGTIPLFSKFGVEDEIEKIYNRRVPLPNGGYLVIEQTEALVSIDVNSGRFTDEEDLEDTALKTNLEAAQEIARQLRLRDLGGVIVNDFIDMLHEQNRHEVERAFNSALKRDRAKCWVSRISRFGIIEMTRQRVRPSLERTTYEPCKHCRGTGMVKSARTTGTAVLRQLQVGLATRKKDLAEVVVHPEVQSYLLNHRRKQIYSMEEYFQKSITILGNPTYEPGRYTIQFK